MSLFDIFKRVTKDHPGMEMPRSIVTNIQRAYRGEPRYMTIRDLRHVIERLPDSAWVCVDGGPATTLIAEHGASEPFVYIGRQI